MHRKTQYKEEYWTLLPAKAMVLYGLDAHSIKEMEKGYVDVEKKRNEVDESL